MLLQIGSRTPGAVRLGIAAAVVLLSLEVSGRAQQDLLFQPLDDRPPSIRAEATETPSAPPSLVDQARQVAEPVVKPFRDALLGQSLIVGIAYTQPDLKIYSASDTTQPIEEYKSGAFAPSIHYSTAAKASERYLEQTLASGAVTFVTINGTAAYGTFSAHQTMLQTTTGAAHGTIHGDYLYGAALVNVWLIQDSSAIPWALRFGSGLGAGFVRFHGEMDYAFYSVASGTWQDVHATIADNGLKPLPVIPIEVEIRVKNISFAVYGPLYASWGAGKSSYSANGRKIEDTLHLFEYTNIVLGYVFSF